MVGINDEHLRIVIRNLLENGEKYSPDPSTPIEVIAMSKDNEVIVSVKDRGMGIRDEDVAHLFDLFYRAPAARETQSGYGIGLSACARLVAEAGGRIWARPRCSGGSEFSVAIPALQVQDGGPDHTEAHEPAAT